MQRLWFAFALTAASVAGTPVSEPPTQPVEIIARLSGPMQTGITVSHQGRIFINYPRWGDQVLYSVAEIKHGQPVPFPDTPFNRYDPAHPADCLVSVQSVVIDPQDRLWILDTGSIKFAPTHFGGPKLVGIDLATGHVFKLILFPPTVALPTTYLNDVRFDLRQGAAGIAYITDSANKGPNGIIVVDLATGQSWRRLNNHPSTRAVPNFVPVVEGKPLMQRQAGQPPRPLTTGIDGIALSPDGSRLYYSPLAGRHLYSVSTTALADRSRTDAEVAATVVDEGDKGGASDGLEMDSHGDLFATDYEHRAIRLRRPGGRFEIFAKDPRIVWPDTLSVAADGYLYLSNNQLPRQASYNNGHDLRVPPYTLMRVRIVP